VLTMKQRLKTSGAKPLDLALRRIQVSHLEDAFERPLEHYDAAR